MFCIPLHGKSHLPSSALLSGVLCCFCPLTEPPANCQKHQPFKNTQITTRTASVPSPVLTHGGKHCLGLPQLPALQQDLKSTSHHLLTRLWLCLIPSNPWHCSALTHTSLSQAAALLRGACSEPSQGTARTKERLALLRGGSSSAHTGRDLLPVSVGRWQGTVRSHLTKECRNPENYSSQISVFLW